MQIRFALIKHTHDLGDIEDFSISSPADGDLIEYDSTTGKWINVPVASLTGITEAVQDILGAMLLDTASVNLTYNDGTGQLSADVLPAGVDHDSLLNFVADEHVAHSGVTLTAGAGLTGGGTIAASRSFAVGAGTGITVNADDVALSAATQASLLLADSSIQPGDNNALLTNGAGYITSASLPVGANPTGTIGLTAVNGSAGTFLRSDGAPALSQAIVPTWTGQHIFSAVTLFADGTAAAPSLSFNADTDTGVYRYSANNLGFAVGGVSRALIGSGSAVLALTSNGAVGGVYIGFYESNAYATNKGYIGFVGGADDNFYIWNSENAPVVIGVNSANSIVAYPSIIEFYIAGNSRGGINNRYASFGPLASSVAGSTGVQLGASGSGYAAIGINTEFTGTSNTYNYGVTDTAGLIDFDNGGAGWHFRRANSGSSGAAISFTELLHIASAGELRAGDGSASAPTWSFLSDTNTGIYRIAADQLGFAEGGTGYRIGYRDIPRRTSGFARGECLAVSSGITLNTSDMAAGYSFTVYNDSASAITITQGSGVTLRLVDTATTGNRTLAARGMAFIWCNSGTEAVISGVT